jgi:hypothetical protein
MAADADGKPIEIPAHWFKAYAPQCGVSVADVNGDAKPDMVVEAAMGDELEVYQNVSTPSGSGFVFKKAGTLRAAKDSLHPGGGYRYFDVADADGDGTRDVLNSTGEPLFFKGASAESWKQAIAPGETFPPGAIVLRNGLAVGAAIPAYSNCTAVTLDAMKPESAGTNATVLKVYARVYPKGEKQKMVLIRFSALPPDTVEKAELALFAPGAMDLMMSCNAIPDGVDPARAEFLSFAMPAFQAADVTRVTWDVTRGVREARQAGRDSVTFLVRMEDTGHYVSGAGKIFFGTEDKDPARRPQLVLVTGSEPGNRRSGGRGY